MFVSATSPVVLYMYNFVCKSFFIHYISFLLASAVLPVGSIVQMENNKRRSNTTSCV